MVWKARGGKSIGPTPDNKSAEQKKTEHDLVHNVGEAIKEGFEYVLKGAGLGGGAWGINKLFGGGAKAAATAARNSRSRAEAAAAETAIAGGATAAKGLGMSQMLFGTSALV